MTERVRVALAFAAEKHKGQVDRAGVDYIEHPKAVAGLLKEPTEDEIIVALLHDTVEDTDATADEIRSLFGDAVADAVACMTHRTGVPYMDYVSGIKKNAIARKVKMADLTHNMDLSRLPDITDADRERVEKYKAAYRMLSED